MHKLNRIITTTALALLLGACGQQSTESTAATVVNNAKQTAAAAAMPSDPDLARLYAQTCRTCHTNSATGAPLTGDTATWQPRVAKGMEVLLQHTTQGFNAMPPMGSCADCSVEEFEALIRFMAGMPSP